METMTTGAGYTVVADENVAPVIGTAGTGDEKQQHVASQDCWCNPEVEVVSPETYINIINDQEFYPRVDDPEVQAKLTRLRDSINRASFNRTVAAL